MVVKGVRESLTIHTPEHVGLTLRLAGLGTRSSAFAIDVALRSVAVLFLFVGAMLLIRWLPALDPTGWLKDLSGTWILAIAFLGYGILDLGYFILFEGLWSGQTPGKRLQGIRVIRTGGRPIGWSESAIRNILRAVDLLGGFYPIGLLVMFLSPKSQRLGDYAADTVVVLERTMALPAEPRVDQAAAPASIPDLDLHLAAMPSQDYRLIRTFLDRRPGMDASHRSQIARSLAHRLMKAWAIPPRADLPYEAFLETVARQYERRKRAL
jgi:uncharacterized RDD family membrane protein YckC